MSIVVFLQQFRAKSRAPCVDSLSQFSMESTTSADSREPQFVAAGDIRKRLTDSIAMPKKKFNVSIVVSPLPSADIFDEDIFLCNSDYVLLSC